MKRKELKNIAKVIAKCEFVIQNSKDNVAIEAAKTEIMRQTSKVSSLEDLGMMDGFVLDFLEEFEKNS